MSTQDNKNVEAPYTVDRGKLIMWYSNEAFQHSRLNMLKDLIMGGEYIITAEDILEKINVVNSKILNEVLPEEITEVHHSLVKIVYK